MKNAYNTSAYGSFAYVYDIFMDKEGIILAVYYYIIYAVWVYKITVDMVLFCIQHYNRTILFKGGTNK